MRQQILLSTVIVFVALSVSGCGKNTTNVSYRDIVPSPIVLTCTEDAECKLTDELYDPCGSIHSIHVNTPQSLIDKYNEAQAAANEGIDYDDCSLPPQIHDYVSMCHNHVCSSAKIQ